MTEQELEKLLDDEMKNAEETAQIILRKVSWHGEDTAFDTFIMEDYRNSISKITTLIEVLGKGRLDEMHVVLLPKLFKKKIEKED